MNSILRISLAGWLAAGALAAAEQPLADRAAAAWQDKDWAKAEALYAQLAEDPAQRGLATFRRGVALLYLGKVDAGRQSLDAAEKAGWASAAVAYRRACADAVEGKTADALALLL
jgi:hypothetical protein